MSKSKGRRTILIAMVDSFTQAYFQAADMPNLREMVKNGFTKPVKACMPTVTNVNNTSICCGAPPSVHGITANSYLDVQTKEEKYMDKADLILAPTIFEKAREAGLKSALVTGKGKSITLLGRHADLTLTAERPGWTTEVAPASKEWVEKLGEPPDIYDYKINHWLFRAVHTVFKENDDINLVYLHTTDGCMHFSAPHEEMSLKHMAGMDELLGRIFNDFPDTELYLTGDHGMNYKPLAYDLNKYLPEKGQDIYFAMSTERDPYVKHHRALGGAAYIWLNDAKDFGRVKDILMRTEGIDGVYTRYEASGLFDLHPDRIGDCMVTGDINTVFGHLDQAKEDMPKNFRSHGSVFELDVPIIVYNTSVDAAKYEDYTNHYHVWRPLDWNK